MSVIHRPILTFDFYGVRTGLIIQGMPLSGHTSVLLRSFVIGPVGPETYLHSSVMSGIGQSWSGFDVGYCLIHKIQQMSRVRMMQT